MEKKIWTIGYNAWVMGGSTNYILETVAKCSEPIDAGKGIMVREFDLPGHGPRVVCDISGGLLGKLEDVRKDIEGCDDIALMVGQSIEAIETYEKMRKEQVDMATFARRFRR